jgi:hypothetical protein
LSHVLTTFNHSSSHPALPNYSSNTGTCHLLSRQVSRAASHSMISSAVTHLQDRLGGEGGSPSNDSGGGTWSTLSNWKKMIKRRLCTCRCSNGIPHRNVSTAPIPRASFQLPMAPTYVNAYSTPSIDEPPVPKDWPGAFRVDHASSVDHKDVTGNGVGSGCRIHGGGWSLRVVVTGLSQV